MSASLASRSSGCGTGNPIDDCWKCDPNWASHRQSLANCAIGFGRNAIGGKNGKIYVVTSPQDDNPANPSPGTLRYAVTRPGALWIIFARSMTIRLKNELMITSFKTIDGRGVTVQITGGAGLTIQYVSNIIVHGISIHDIQATGPARIMSSTSHVGNRGRADGDAISIFTSKNLWIDHCYLAKAADGLIDVIRGSTLITISNNYFTQHDKVTPQFQADVIISHCFHVGYDHSLQCLHDGLFCHGIFD
jgi:pectate lyase